MKFNVKCEKRKAEWEGKKRLKNLETLPPFGVGVKKRHEANGGGTLAFLLQNPSRRVAKGSVRALGKKDKSKSLQIREPVGRS